MCKEEIAFISFMIKPLWETFNDFSNGACDLMVKNLEKNVEQWKKLKADADAELAAEQANQQASEKKDESQKK